MRHPFLRLTCAPAYDKAARRHRQNQRILQALVVSTMLCSPAAYAQSHDYSYSRYDRGASASYDLPSAPPAGYGKPDLSSLPSQPDFRKQRVFTADGAPAGEDAAVTPPPPPRFVQAPRTTLAALPAPAPRMISPVAAQAQAAPAEEPAHITAAPAPQQQTETSANPKSFDWAEVAAAVPTPPVAVAPASTRTTTAMPHRAQPVPGLAPAGSNNRLSNIVGAAFPDKFGIGSRTMKASATNGQRLAAIPAQIHTDAAVAYIPPPAPEKPLIPEKPPIPEKPSAPDLAETYEVAAIDTTPAPRPAAPPAPMDDNSAGFFSLSPYAPSRQTQKTETEAPTPDTVADDTADSLDAPLVETPAAPGAMTESAPASVIPEPIREEPETMVVVEEEVSLQDSTPTAKEKPIINEEMIVEEKPIVEETKIAAITPEPQRDLSPSDALPPLPNVVESAPMAPVNEAEEQPETAELDAPPPQAPTQDLLTIEEGKVTARHTESEREVEAALAETESLEPSIETDPAHAEEPAESTRLVAALEPHPITPSAPAVTTESLVVAPQVETAAPTAVYEMLPPVESATVSTEIPADPSPQDLGFEDKEMAVPAAQPSLPVQNEIHNVLPTVVSPVTPTPLPIIADPMYTAPAEPAPAPAEDLSETSRYVLQNTPSGIGSKQKVAKSPEPIIIKREAPNAGKIPMVDVRAHEEMGLKIEIRKANPNLNSYLEQAYENLIAGRYEIAAGFYQETLKIEPKNEMALFGLATTYQKLGRKEEARDYYARLLAFNPSHREALNNFMALVSEEAPQAAIAELEQLEEQNPDFSPVSAQLGIVYSKMGDYRRAAAKLLRAVQLSPDNISYKYNLAITLDKLGDKEHATELYLELIEQYKAGADIPGNIDTIRNRVIFLNQANRTPR